MDARLRLRFLRAYWTTLVVMASYLSLRLVAPFRSRAWLLAAVSRRHIRNARRVQRTILSLKGLFIKVGQLFSIMTNFLPEEFRGELEGLQDAIEPSGYDHIARRFEEEFGKSPHTMFASFDETPVASASLGQVHMAVRGDGEQVAVKVQHPEIDRIVRSDLRTLRRIVSLVSVLLPKHGLVHVYEEIRAMILAELDFQEEGRNLERIASNFAGDKDVLFPRVFWDQSTTRILTTGYVVGTKITNLGQLEAQGASRRALATKLVHAYCKQIFVDGLYHADPHPGNILVTPDERIALLDFGAVAELSPKMREGIVEFLYGVLAANTDKICSALMTMGFVQQSSSSDEVLHRVVELFHERVTQTVKIESFNLKDVRLDPQEAFDALLELRRMDIGLREISDAFYVPREWILLERTLLLLTGLCTALDESLRPMELIRPYVERLVLRDQDWKSFALETTREVGLQYLTLPGDLKKLLLNANRGRIELRSRDVREGTDRIYALGHQVIWAAFTITCMVLSAVFDLAGDVGASDTARYGAIGFGAVLGLSMIRNRRRR